MSSGDPYEPPRAAEPHGSRAVARALASRKRRRRVLLATTSVTLVCTFALVAMFVVRSPAPPPAFPAAPVTLEAGAVEEWDASSPLLVELRDDKVIVDGVEIARTDDIAKEGRMRKVDGLFMILKQRREEHPEFSRTLLLKVREDVPVVVVKSVFQTAAFAGYPDVRFIAGDKVLGAADAGPL